MLFSRHVTAGLSLLTFCYFTTAAKVRRALDLTWEEGAPNGQSRQMIFVNGQFPGESLIFDEDDDVEVTVSNHMPKNITIHWHGISQENTPWSDGVPGLSQAPIEPNETFVYRFKASPAGTHWYHSHSRMSLVDGLYGALFVRPKEGRPAPWMLISNYTEDIEAMAKAAANPELVILSDWSRFTSDEYWQANLNSGLLLFCVDSILMNGQGEIYCPPIEFLINETAPGIIQSAFTHGEHVTDKGCFPFTEAIEGPWVTSWQREKIPAHLQEGCIPSKGSNATIEVDPGEKWVSINFIAAATFKQIDFSIDEHPMWIYEIDGNYVEPRPFVAAAISAGERYSAMVKLNNTPGVYTIRLPDSGSTQVISGFAQMIYKGSNSAKISQPYISYGALNVSEWVASNSYTPYVPITDHMPAFHSEPLPAKADEEYLLIMGRLNASYAYTVNSTKHLFPVDWNSNHPLLFYPNATTGGKDDDFVIRTKNGSWVDLILQVSTIPGDEAAFTHVMHKHGSKTWRIGQGQGIWNYSSVAEAIAERPLDFDLDKPGYRDTWLTQFSGAPEGGWWIVLRYQVTNPGPWLFHCHIELHIAGGMAMAILDGVDAWPDIPEEYQNAVREHAKWVANNSLPVRNEAAKSIRPWGHNHRAAGVR